MSIAFFGIVRSGRVKRAMLSAAHRWIGERRSTWELRLDWLDDLLAEPDEKARS